MVKLSFCAAAEIVTCKAFELSQQEMHMQSRLRHIARPRQVAMALAHDVSEGSLSLKQIGFYYGKRDHSTAAHAIKQVAKLRRDEEFNRKYASLRDIVAELTSPPVFRRGLQPIRFKTRRTVPVSELRV